jgi:hypothetical protein
MEVLALSKHTGIQYVLEIKQYQMQKALGKARIFEIYTDLTPHLGRRS